MSHRKKPGFSTTAIHHGQRPDPATGAHVPPIYQTSTFVAKNFEQLLAIMKGEEAGYVYTRAGNPTHTVLEEKMAALEHGEKACATASGMAAVFASILVSAKKGAHIISLDTLYGSSYTLLEKLLPQLGIEVTFVDATKAENVEKALRKETKIIFVETPANPTMGMVDIKTLGELARGVGAKLMVDNTFMTPYFQRPIPLGADVVIHSATKYLNGHGDTLGGVVVGDSPFIQEVRRILILTGGIINPFNAWLVVRGLKTLALRMERHNSNALQVARFLEGHPKVSRVLYPGLPSHPQHELGKRQMSGFGGMLSFRVKGGGGAAAALLDHVKLCARAVSLGDVSTLIEIPAFLSHYSIPPKERLQLGITDDLLRLSVGIEDPWDIIEDLAQALDLPRPRKGRG